MYRLLTRIAVEVSIASTLAADGVAGRIIRAFDCGWACASDRMIVGIWSVMHILNEVLTVWVQIDGARRDGATDIVSDTHGNVEAVHEGN